MTLRLYAVVVRQLAASSDGGFNRGAKQVMKKVALVVATLAVTGSAHAADLAFKAPPPPVLPVFSWTGFYIGVNGGGASGKTDWTYVHNGATANHDSSGALGGGTVGFNWQFPSTNWVIGAEGDFDGADIRGSTSCPVAAYICTSKLTDFATVRGRLGYADGRVMVYGTGGGAWARDQITTSLNGATFGGTTSRDGWVAGGGVEWAAWGPLSLKVEYLRYDFGSKTSTVDFGLPVDTTEKGNMVRVGLNWKLWP
jgi:outer membrane immunogenic protein